MPIRLQTHLALHALATVLCALGVLLGARVHSQQLNKEAALKAELQEAQAEAAQLTQQAEAAQLEKQVLQRARELGLHHDRFSDRQVDIHNALMPRDKVNEALQEVLGGRHGLFAVEAFSIDTTTPQEGLLSASPSGQAQVVTLTLQGRHYFPK